jgi:hypothetical protein
LTAELDRTALGRMVVLTWFGVAVLLVLRAAYAPGGLVLSTDDNMRLVEVRDLLSGQSWFDTTQWRMNAPYGLPMHWSRLVDVGIAGLILLFRLVTNPKTAETWALYVWPLLPLLPALLALTHIAYRLTDRIGALFALALGASCVAAIIPFKPGNIDHHNVQLALSLSMVACLIDVNRSCWAGAFAALAAALTMGVGMETLPYVLMAFLALAVWWIVDGGFSTNVAAFGITFAIANLLLLFSTTATAYRFSSACDTFSGFYALVGAITGLGIVALTKLARLATAAQRAAGAAGLCVVVLIAAAVIGPACLRGPYAAVDPRIVPIWFSGVDEVQSPFTMGRMAPGDFVGGYLYCVLAAAASGAAIFLVRRQSRPAMGMICAIAFVAFVIASIEMRALYFAVVFATPGVVVVAIRLLERVPVSKTVSILATFAAVLVSSDASYAFVGERIQKSLPLARQYTPVQMKWVDACMMPPAFHQLAALPRGRVAALIDMGPMILASTHHSTLAGPYHRNAAGILDAFAIFAGSAVEQRATLRRRSVDYVAICTPEPDYKHWGRKAKPDSLLKADAKGEVEPWLEPVVTQPIGGEIRIFRVRHDRLG